MGVTLYVGGHGTRYAGAVLDLHGTRCCSAAHRPFGGPGTLLHKVLDGSRLRVLLDSGAFTDPPARRLSLEGALDRQLAWDTDMSERLEQPWHSEALASYDVLIDEKWAGETRTKGRWSVRDADTAVSVTVEAARYLAAQREKIAPRIPLLAVQGVDAAQYRECAAEVLSVARPGDWIGLGGWCILGRWQRQWMPTFWQSMWATIPLVAAAGIRRVHIFGSLWLPALGGLLWLCDQHDIAVSTDSARPLMDLTRADGPRAGARGKTWRESVDWWQAACSGLRETHHYRRPPNDTPYRQMELVA